MVLNMQEVQAKMHKNLLIAMDGFKNFAQKEMDIAASHIKKIQSLKYQMEAIATQIGYSQACKASIPICKGDCCKWHFPKHLNHIDFFIAIFHMSEYQQEKFAQLIFNNEKNQCPVLLKTGCFLSFEQRPVLCTNAYPCFADRSYWIEKEKKNILFKKSISFISELF